MAARKTVDEAAIAAAALRLLQKTAFADLSLAQLARTLKTSEAALSLNTTDDLLPLLVRHVDAAMERETISANDTPTDALFALLMARTDALQAHREAYVNILGYARAHPASWHIFMTSLYDSMQQALQQAQLDAGFPKSAMQAAGLAAVYAWTLHAWQKDTQADLPATMRALDQGLRRAAQVAGFIGL